MIDPAKVYQGSIRLVIFDVDGVLTDGTLTYDSDGEALKNFNVRDGLAVALLHSHGVRAGILSGKASPPLDARIRQLGFDVAVTGQLEKTAALGRICKDLNVDSTTIAYVGDDVVDLPLSGRVGRFYAPADAHPLVIKGADHVLVAEGGRGAAREAAEHVLLSGGLSLDQIYEPLINKWGRFNAVQ